MYGNMNGALGAGGHDIAAAHGFRRASASGPIASACRAHRPMAGIGKRRQWEAPPRPTAPSLKAPSRNGQLAAVVRSVAGWKPNSRFSGSGPREGAALIRQRFWGRVRLLALIPESR